MGRIAAEISESTILSRCVPVPESGCWLWMGSWNPDGYGQITIAGKTMRAHRVAYSVFLGDIDHGMHVCHKCDTTACVNPKHLFLDTNAGNIADKVRKGRQVKGVNVWANKLTEKQVIEIRNSPLTHRKLSNIYGVDYGTIGRVKRGEIWSWLQEKRSDGQD